LTPTGTGRVGKPDFFGTVSYEALVLFGIVLVWCFAVSTHHAETVRARLSRASRVRKYVLMFVATALVLETLIGNSGFVATRRAREDRRALHHSLGALREENAALRRQVERLKSDPRTIEAVARQELGLARPEELIFLVRP
jgi:cell division protein FtsB